MKDTRKKKYIYISISNAGNYSQAHNNNKIKNSCSFILKFFSILKTLSDVSSCNQIETSSAKLCRMSNSLFGRDFKFNFTSGA